MINLIKTILDSDTEIKVIYDLERIFEYDDDSFYSGDATEISFEELDEEHISIYVQVEIADGEPVVMEPNKCHEWGWFNWCHLPHPLFPLFKHYVNAAFLPEGIVCSA